ncbi:hypothetical protein [Mycolicibacterium arenosum]|uniref:Uncharacterized protein n=1 Tax=Mycolicibacterium arenosum TaxID=2952157 RepID=A0ABT1MBH2_9MYCO|nr:hypothetical protein [Mycolicibacterium sp. CAU 1645]MCP9276505.1 hypothetical protein [Mycolicibacterium sp. CAU 1645]
MPASVEPAVPASSQAGVGEAHGGNDEIPEAVLRLLASRSAGNADRREQTLERLDKASRNADTARSMTSPLQVTTMSLLPEQRHRPPTSRYAVVENYDPTRRDRLPDNASR